MIQRIASVSSSAARLTGLVLAAVALAVFAGPARGDTVLMKDGRTIEGMITQEDETALVVDTMISGIRAANLTLQKGDVKSVTKGPVPDGFYTADASVPPRADGAVTKADRSGLYLVVPIKGELGTDTVAGGVGRAVSYARRYRVPNVVFVLNTTGGDLDEALMIVRTIQQNRGFITYHAVVRQCRGAALGIPLLSDTLHVMPGAVVGDTPAALGEGSQQFAGEDEQVLRSELGRRAFEYAVSQGSTGEIVRAMLDPLESLSAWNTPDGRLGMAMRLPGDVPEEDVIFTNESGDMLVLSYEQMAALGVPPLDGTIDDLGEALGIDGWEKESDFGERSMEDFARQNRAARASRDAQFKRQLQENLLKRETTLASIENNIQQAARWDPTEGDYATYARKYRWNAWGSSRNSTVYTAGTRFTKDSRNEWTRRSDMAMSYLSKAARACRSMERLDQQAVELGLEPTFPPGELDMMIKDLDVKYRFVSDQRRRKGT